VLTINFEGAQTLLTLLKSVTKGNRPTETELQSVLTANEFFVDFYCQWEGVTPESLVETMCRFNQPDFEPLAPVLSALAKGFRQAIEEIDCLQTKLDFLMTTNTSAIVDRVLAFLPRHTPLQSTIHITIDGFNGGFQHRGEMGLSLLGNITNREQFESGIAHELHHVGFYYWAECDPIRQAVLKERSGRAVAVRHVQNLLSEGLAIFYCSPDMMRDDRMTGAYASKLAKYRQEESRLFVQAEKVLALSLNSDADFETCRRAFEVMAIDPDGILPIAHYLGVRMIETMSQSHPQERIIECVQSLSHFLPFYNQAAQGIGAFIYDPSVVEQFSRIFKATGAG